MANVSTSVANPDDFYLIWTRLLKTTGSGSTVCKSVQTVSKLNIFAQKWPLHLTYEGKVNIHVFL
jgi:hypothetical protein